MKQVFDKPLNVTIKFIKSLSSIFNSALQSFNKTRWCTLWSWGWDGFWQLGNGDDTQTNSIIPNQVKCVDDASLSVNDISSAKKGNLLYPKPAKDFVMLQSSKQVSEVKIYNLTGAVVKTISKVTDNRINITDLPAGIYIVKTNDSTEGMKLIKKIISIPILRKES